MLQRMRKWTMPDVMKQHGELGALVFFFRDLDAFEPKVVKDAAHEMQRSKSMLKSRMDSAGVNQIGKAQLFYVA